MKIINNTPFEATAIPMMGPGNRPVVTVIVKGTFEFLPDGTIREAEAQIPIAFGDELNDKEKGGSVKFESDMAPFKPNADIVLVGSAHTQGGKMVQAIDVSLRVGSLQKIIRVFGDRRWNVVSMLSKESASVPQPFSTLEITYERAFGGIDMEGGGYCKENLAGVGYYADKSKKEVKDLPLPNLEDPSHLITSRKDCPKPAGYGFYGRAWEPRLGYLGTYDEKWKKERAPDPPKDFNFAFYNAAHPDLIARGYLKGDEAVELRNLSPDGDIRFRLPGIQLNCEVAKYVNQSTDEDAPEYSEYDVKAEKVSLNLDTLCIIPDEKRFFLVWRGLCPVGKIDTAEVKEIEIG